MMSDMMQFADKELAVAAQSNLTPWRVLVVDDDGEVHQATRFALNDKTILGRPLSLMHAYSATEAEQLLQQYNDIAVVLLDVVMESEDSGLNLISLIRQELNYQPLRIILRTGQPGMAPEENLVAHYDIHDYMLKSEVSHARLSTSLTTAIRAYQQLHDIKLVEQQLVHAVTQLDLMPDAISLTDFVAYYWAQLESNFRLQPLLMVSCSCEQPKLATVLAADQEHERYIGCLVSELPEQFFTLDDLFEVLLTPDVAQYQDAIVLSKADQRLLILLKDDDYRQQVVMPSWHVFQQLMQRCFRTTSTT